MEFKSVEAKEIKGLEFINKINKQWALLTVRNSKGEVNTMTIAWGQCGYLWYKEIISAYVRESRYTLDFMDDSSYFSISFFNELYKDKLAYLGSHSGRDEDKISKVNLTVVNNDLTSYFKEASEVIILKKIYKHKIVKENFIDENVRKKAYGDNNYHYCFVGEIVECLKNDSSI